MNVSPASRSTYIRVAEPDVPIKWLSLVDSFQPDLRGDHSGIAPNSDALIRIFLALVLDPQSARHLKQVGLGVDLAGAKYHNHIVRQYSVHCVSVIIFNGRLVLGIESCDYFRVICRIALAMSDARVSRAQIKSGLSKYSRIALSPCVLVSVISKSVSLAEFAENEIMVLSVGMACKTSCLSLGR